MIENILIHWVNLPECLYHVIFEAIMSSANLRTERRFCDTMIDKLAIMTRPSPANQGEKSKFEKVKYIPQAVRSTNNNDRYKSNVYIQHKIVIGKTSTGCPNFSQYHIRININVIWWTLSYQSFIRGGRNSIAGGLWLPQSPATTIKTVVFITLWIWKTGCFFNWRQSPNLITKTLISLYSN